MEFRDFQPVLAIATSMNAFDRPWCVAGGWAIDLFLNQMTRQHASVEIAILRDDQIAIRDHLHDHEFRVIDGSKPRAWRDRQMLMPPVFELHALSPQRRKFDVFLNERIDAHWVFRGHLKIRLPIDEWVRRAAFGVPVIAPAVALLYKSRHARPCDDLDFRSALPRLSVEDRRWLLDALMFTQPRHPWLEMI